MAAKSAEKKHTAKDKIQVRCVLYYTLYKINGQDGPKELSATLGFGIPIFNNWNNRSVLNISMQYSNVSATGMIKEQNFRINIGFTFNERWFMKWKVE